MIDDLEFAKTAGTCRQTRKTGSILTGPASVPYVDMPAAVPYPDVADLKRRGKLIDAIKLYRTYTGASLGDAKNYVESIV